jgi:hypothetical protein
MKRSTIASSLALAVLIAASSLCAGCTHHQRQVVSETVVRNVVAAASAKKFSDAGHPIQGHLTCRAVVNGKKVSTSCSGKTTSGVAATVAGAGTLTNSDTTVKGLWVGKAGGKTIFQETCLGAKC